MGELDGLLLELFRALAQAFHPDHGGDKTVMVALNQALENLERRSCA